MAITVEGFTSMKPLRFSIPGVAFWWDGSFAGGGVETRGRGDAGPQGGLLRTAMMDLSN